MSARARSSTVLALACALAALAPSTARADHTRHVRLTDEMPYTLRPGEARAGLWKLELGLWGNPLLDELQIGTYTWPWLVWAAGAPFANGYLKAQLVDHGPWAATVGGGVVYVDLGFDEQDATLTVVPLEAHLGARVGDALTLAAGVIFTAVTVRGRLEEDSTVLRGGAGVSNLQLPLTAEWRLGRHTALVTQARFVGWQDTAAAGVVSTRLDDRTTADVTTTAESDAFDPVRALALTADVAWSWRHVNLRAGVTYGNYNVPVVNLVVPEKIVMPNFDLYWRW